MAKTSKPLPKRISKAAFVRSLPLTVSAAEVVKRAKAAGHTLEIGYVYNIRSNAKVRNEAALHVPEAVASALVERSAERTRDSLRAKLAGARAQYNLDDIFRALASEIGLAHAARLIEVERAKVRQALGR